MLLRPAIWLGCVLGCALAMCAQDLGSVPMTMSVCDLLREPAKVNGATIAIRGFISPRNTVYTSTETVAPRCAQPTERTGRR